jgi:hypothetical protein
MRTTAYYRCKLLDCKHSLYGRLQFRIDGEIEDYKLFVVEILSDALETLKNEGHNFYGIELVTKEEFDYIIAKSAKQHNESIRYGEWLYDDWLREGTKCHKCSLCGWIDSMAKIENFELFPFCPNCKAKMK